MEDFAFMREKNFHLTLYASYLGYITQAIVNNLAPLLFLTFQREFQISLNQIAFLVTFNFGVQMIVDFLATKFIDKIGYRIPIVGAHIFSFIGLIGLGIFPLLFLSPYLGLLIAVFFYALGGGLIEVLVSPIVEALPTEEKSSAMSILHSFYCWGHVLVVILSTIYFNFFGMKYWYILPCLWALLPLFNAVLFSYVPLRIYGEEETTLSMKELFSMKLFWIFIILMLCSGASEQAMSQWASFFAESGLQVSKTMGDLLGPCLFAVLMGISRAFYGKYSNQINLRKFLNFSAVLCIFSYLLAVFSPFPLLSFIGCGMCGFSVGILWPGVFSLSAKSCSQGGTAMFALFALAGDIGCAAGPSFVGFVSNLFGGNLKAGILFSILFPVLFLLCMKGLKQHLKTA